MHRRHFIGVSSALAAGSMAGCLGLWDNPDTPEDMDVEILDDEGRSPRRRIVESGLVESDEEHPKFEGVLVVTAENEADEYFLSDEKVTSFVAETHFDESYLVAIVTFWWSGEDEVTVGAIDRTDEGIHVALNVDSPDPATLEATPRTHLLRITDERSEIPGVIVVAHNDREERIRID